MIVTIGSIKGGVGKSLVSTNFAFLRSLRRKRLLLIDADDQETTMEWVRQRTESNIDTPWDSKIIKSKSIRTELLNLKDKYDDIIIDCGGRDTDSLRAALSISDVFLTPFQPKSFDIWTSRNIGLLVQEAVEINPTLSSYCFINFAKPRGVDNDEAKQILATIPGITVLSEMLGRRESFSNATADGRSVVEIKSDLKATKEILALHDAIFSK